MTRSRRNCLSLLRDYAVPRGVVKLEADEAERAVLKFEPKMMGEGEAL